MNMNMEENHRDPWKKVLLLFVIFILLVGCTNTPRLKNDDFITAWTIAVSVVGLCIGVVFSLVLRSLTKSIEGDNSINSGSLNSINDLESGRAISLPPPSYSKCCPSKKGKDKEADGLPSYVEALAAQKLAGKSTPLPAVHQPVTKY